MLKTVCIKTNNKNICNYLLNECEYFELQNVYFSCYDFKYYTNILIHYVGDNIDLFLNKVSTLLSYAILDFYEPSLIRNLINSNYFYFSVEEKKHIYNLCLTNIDFSTSVSMVNIISNSLHEYFLNNKYVILDGFVIFKLKDYIKQLDSIVDMCVNKFIIDREYSEFISLLKTYVQTTPCASKVVHLIYKNQESILLDSYKNVIKYSSDLINQKYLSDITFSSNDFALNSLLTLLPEKLYVHLLDSSDDFINTIKLIFTNKVYICTDCDLCHIYNKKRIDY